MAVGRRRLSRALLAGSIVLFLASLTQNGFCVLTGGAERCDNYGFALVGLGWLQTLEIGEVGPFVVLPWYANSCLTFAWIFVLASRRRTALALAGAGTVLSLGFLLGRSVQIS